MKVIDLHADTLSLLDLNNHLNLNDLQIDANKLFKGNYLVQALAVFTNLHKTKNPFLNALERIFLLYKEINLNPRLKLLTSKVNKDYINIMLTIEEGDIINGDLNNIKFLKILNVKMMSLCWNYENRIVNSNGLTIFGKEMIKELEKQKIIIDISHLNDKGFYDFIKVAKMPFVASHSNTRTICNNKRNLTDDMIEYIINHKGIIGINFYNHFLGGNTINDIVKHITHIKKLGGINNIALGTDFDGIDKESPINDASEINKLKDALISNGYSLNDIEKVFYLNFLRFYNNFYSIQD